MTYLSLVMWMRRSALIAIIVLTIPAATYALWRNVPGVLEENHLIESSQAVLLFLAAVLYALHSRRSSPPNSALPIYHGTLALFCLSLFTREMDIDQIGAHAAWPVIEIAFRSLIVILWVYLGIRLVRGRHRIWMNRRNLASQPGSLVVYAGILLYCVSWFFDKGILLDDPPAAKWLEETLQLQAAFCFSMSPLVSPKINAIASDSISRENHQPHRRQKHSGAD